MNESGLLKISELGEQSQGSYFIPRQVPGPRRNGTLAERLSVLSGSSQRSGMKESGSLKYLALRAVTYPWTLTTV
jgi:hypothetical protein